uniref:Alpha-1,3-glucosyltransferase n=1 Tax=Ascaris lumbricoides TaxID=6252 RepID=A0A0M3I0F3_ASCLU
MIFEDAGSTCKNFFLSDPIKLLVSDVPDVPSSKFSSCRRSAEPPKSVSEEQPYSGQEGLSVTSMASGDNASANVGASSRGNVFCERWFWMCFAFVFMLKFLLVPMYHSTDFEVHRNWMAITYNLPMRQWYYENTSKWTLDYPPLFAYFELALAKVAKVIVPSALIIHKEHFISPQLLLFHRFSVIVCDIIYVIANGFLANSLILCGVCGENSKKCAVAKVIVPSALIIQKEHFISPQLLLFHRFSVIVCDFIYVIANGFLANSLILCGVCGENSKKCAVGGCILLMANASLILVDNVIANGFLANSLILCGVCGENSKKCAVGGCILLMANASLILVDNIHFQYNGILTAILLFSLAFAIRGQLLVAASLFCVLLNMKHIYAYYAIAYVIFYLLAYIFTSFDRFVFSRAIKLAIAMWIPFFISFGPFLYVGGAKIFAQILSRLFPFQRGLTHAYWAPNLWAIYNFVDLGLYRTLKVLNKLPSNVQPPQYTTGLVQGSSKIFAQILSRLFPFQRGLTHAYWAPNLWAVYNFVDLCLYRTLKVLNKLPSNVQPPQYTTGLVQQYSHAVLPSVNALTALMMTLLLLSPLIASLFMKRRRSFVLLLTHAAFAFFLAGYHVHEKAILLVTVPYTILAATDHRFLSSFVVLSTVANISLFPLFFTPFENIIKVSVVFCYHFLSECVTKFVCVEQSSKSARQKCCLIGVLLVQSYCLILHKVLFHSRFEYVPLMLTSVSTAIVIMLLFVELLWKGYSTQPPHCRCFKSREKLKSS